jgi:hypothetical protein
MATDKHLAIVDQISLHREDGDIRRSQRCKANEEPPTGGFSHFQTPGIAPNEKPGQGERGVMFRAPLVLHGQDQDGKSAFIWSVFFSR